MGIHAWHCLLDMVNATSTPEEIDYGLVGTQRDNVMATLESMTSTERCHMLISFCHVMALLASDVADAAEEVLAGEVEVTVERNGTAEEEAHDETGLMERYLKKKDSDGGPTTDGSVSGPSDAEDRARGTTAATADSSKGDLMALFDNPFELEIRSLVAALELVPAVRAQKRAVALLERLLFQFGPTGGSRDKWPEGLTILESALVTFLPEGAMGDSNMMSYATLDPQEQDFVDYWWGLLMRQLRKFIDGPDWPKREVEVAPTRTHVDEEDLALSEEELDLIRRMEEEDKAGTAERAGNEYQRLLDSQEEDSIRASQASLQADAARYRDWEQWLVAEEMRSPERQRPGNVTLELQGRVDEGPWQTMSWTMQAGQSVSLRLAWRGGVTSSGPSSPRKRPHHGSP